MNLDISYFVNKIKNQESTKGWYLCGSYGVGKTYAMRQLIDKTKIIFKYGINQESLYTEYPVEMIVWPEYIANLKKAMDKDKYQPYIPETEKLKKQRVLIIDDIGGETPSDWELRDILFPLLNYRIEKKLTTFFTSNFNINQLEKYYKKKCSIDAVDRVIDRIYGLTQEHQLIGKNWRREMSQEIC